MNAYIRYFGYFGYLLLLWFISSRRHGSVTRKEQIGNETVTRYNWLFALLSIAPLVYLAATRSVYFGDTNVYRRGFEQSPSSLAGFGPFMDSLTKDRGFYLFAALMRTVLGNRPVVYFGIVAAIQLLLLISMFRKYSPDLLISLFIFVASADYLSFMHNGIRQFVAVCMILAASKFIFEQRYIPAILVILVASQFHQSALIMIPFIFITQGDPWNKSTVGLLFGALIAVMVVNQFTGVLDSLLKETQYANIVDDWTEWDDNGTNPLRVLVYCVPALLSLLGLRYIREENDPVINICTNMSVISAGLYIVSMVTSGIYIGRLPIYVCLYANCILLPWEINNLFGRRSSEIIQGLMIVLFLAFYYYQVHFTWGVI